MKKIIIVAALLILTWAAFFYSIKTFARKDRPPKLVFLKNESYPQKIKYIQKRKAEWMKLKDRVRSELSAFRGVAGVVIKDLDMNWEIQSNKKAKIPSASLVKIPIMMSYYQASADGKVNLQDKIELRNSQKTTGSGILKSSPAGAVFTIEELIGIMIIHSDNTASNLLINLLGMDTLNSYFAKLGLRDTTLVRKMMDFKARKQGVENYTTAADMAYALERIYHNRLVNKEVSQKCMKYLLDQKINDRIPKWLPRGTVVAHKTGLENGVCHDVGIIFTDKADIIICVLIKHKNKRAFPTKRIISRIALCAYNYSQNI